MDRLLVFTGRSTPYTAFHAERYATGSQLGVEERIIAAASRRGALVPRLAPAAAARLLGSDQAQLEAQLSRSVSADVTTGTGSGLHLDQAAAAYRLMTSDRRAEVMIGPAGTGKPGPSLRWPAQARG